MRKLCNKIIVVVFLVSFLPQVLTAAETDTPLEEPQIERGRPNKIIDTTGNILSIPQKIILLNPKIDSHHISADTEKYIANFIRDNPVIMKDVKVRINQWTPVGDIKRLVKNKKISWWWRVFPGIPTTLVSSLTGRLFGGDHYNPYTDTICIFSDEPAVLLHEAMHAKDFAEKATIDRTEADWYAIGRILPPIALHQETVASESAIEYLKEKGDRDQEIKSYRSLYPAFGTYLGGYSGVPYGNVAGAAVGHVAGFLKQKESRIGYSAIDNARRGKNKITDRDLDSLAKNLIIHDTEERVSINKILASQKAPVYFKDQGCPQ